MSGSEHKYRHKQRSVGLLLLAAIVGDTTGVPGVFGFVSPAEAVVGRPLTPVSVADAARRVARRTTRRPVEAGYYGYGYPSPPVIMGTPTTTPTIMDAAALSVGANPRRRPKRDQLDRHA
jgi:hypothetical protein